MLAEALQECGDYTFDQIDVACQLEAERHMRVWLDEHRTLQTAERLDAILAEVGAVLQPATKERLIRAFEEGILERPPIPVAGSCEVVKQLGTRYRLAIISDVGFSPGRVLREMLRRYGLLEDFKSVVFSDEAGCSKPHVEVFKRTARTLSVEPDEVVHVGDLEHTDIIGAKGAGCRAIRFTGVTAMTEGEQTAADDVVASLSELPASVEALQTRYC